MASAANSVAIRGALLLVLLVGALVSNAEAARNPGLVAGSVAAAPVATVHPSSMLGCIMNCGIQVAHCEFSCTNKPFLETPACAVVCMEANAECLLRCGAPALGAAPPQA